MPNLERNDVNMTHHVAQSKRNTIKTQLMTQNESDVAQMALQPST
ncbi:hypothetical protein T03_10891 [Trichinella britovi]|uniref:Uncharacterized protein n=1 Tax=Trichinella britovi TaxID=45882 RepID=A0A0V1AMG6_TRIBR|nr:hypothetical protein T03_10891 [Trichinella britovi]